MAVKAKRTKTKRRIVSPSSSKRLPSKIAAPKPNRAEYNERFETALKFLREGSSQRRAAEIGVVSVKRFRRFLRSNKLAKFKGGRWLITDRRTREVAIISEGHTHIIKLRGFSSASLAMRHRAAVQQFLDSNDASLLAPFEDQEVTNIAKQTYRLETRPNVLLRMTNAESDADMKIYRLID